MVLGVVSTFVTVNHFAVGRKDKDASLGARVDVSSFVDDDTTVGGANQRFAICSKTPTGDRVKCHQPASHTDRLSFSSKAGQGKNHECKAG